MVNEITIENFEAEVKEANTLVVVDFWASWCGPCKMLSPIVDEVSEEIGDVKFCKINVDDEPELATKFGIQSIPTLCFIKKGVLLDMSIGYMQKEQLLKKVEENK